MEVARWHIVSGVPRRLCGGIAGALAWARGGGAVRFKAEDLNLTLPLA